MILSHAFEMHHRALKTYNSPLPASRMYSTACKSLRDGMHVIHSVAIAVGLRLGNSSGQAYKASGTSFFAAALAIAFPPVWRSLTLMVTWDTPFKILYGLRKSATLLRYAAKLIYGQSVPLTGWHKTA